MSIFGIIGLSAMIGAFVAFIITMTFCLADGDEIVCRVVSLGIGALICVGGVFVGIAINEEEERLFISQYEAQKEVIEISLESDVLTGFERIELVKQASELNGDLARRKAKYDIWHYVTYDDGLYDDVEQIKLK